MPGLGDPSRGFQQALAGGVVPYVLQQPTDVVLDPTVGLGLPGELDPVAVVLAGGVALVDQSYKRPTVAAEAFHGEPAVNEIVHKDVSHIQLVGDAGGDPHVQERTDQGHGDRYTTPRNGEQVDGLAGQVIPCPVSDTNRGPMDKLRELFVTDVVLHQNPPM